MPLRYLAGRLGMLGIIPAWDLKGLELCCGWWCAGWGYQTLAADALHSNHVYVPFLEIAPSWVWGLTMFVVGMAQIVACLWHVPLLTRMAALAGVFVWTFTILALIGVSPRVASLPGYIGLCLSCLWLHLRG